MIDEIIGKIVSISDMEDSDIRKKIKEKQDELSGLISEEGAAYIVAKELGINLMKQDSLYIENIMPGMQNIDIIGKVTKISPVREFKTDRASGRVLNIFLADKTSSIRMSLWNTEIDKFSFEQGDVVRVRGYVKEDNLGNPEIRLGRFGSIQKSEQVIDVMEAPIKKYERSSIIGFKESSYQEVRATLIHVFETNPFYEICSECGSRLKDGKCEDHPEAEASFGIVINSIIDDGTESIRAVFFGENAEKILGMNVTDAKKLFEEGGMQALIEKMELGKEFVFAGRVRRNAYFDRLEFIVNSINEVNVKQEIEMLAGG